MNNSVVFSHSQSCVTIITVYFQNTVITLKRNPILMSSHSPLPPHPSSQKPITDFVPMDLPVLDTSYKWCPLACGFFSLSVLSGAIHAVARVGTSFPLVAE